MTSANLETFTHKPLTPGRVIRVLTLQPSRHVESDITCDLNELRLDEYTSTFEALSYVWGVRKDGFQVVCQGKLLSVTETCLQALRYLRHKRKPRQLWVDAICIDQTSKTERGHQVGLMGEIYDVASDVVVWLGESSPEFEQAFREINTLSSKARRGIKAVCKKASKFFPTNLGIELCFTKPLSLALG